MNTIFDDCKQCDTADEKVNYLAGIVVNRLSTPRNDFYLKPHYTSSEACKYLQISKKTLDNLCSTDEIARGKAGGLYVDQKLVLSGNLDNMSEKELESKMKQILDDHKTLINITPEEEIKESIIESDPDNDSE